SIAAGLLNDDDSPDLASEDFTGNKLLVRMSNGDGTFGPVQPITAPSQGPWAVTIADLDRDGVNDLACAFSTPAQNVGQVGVLPGHGDGTFGTAQLAAVAQQPNAITVDDIDGDGAPDAAAPATPGQVCLLLSQLGPWDNLGKALAGTQGLPKQTGEGTLQGGQPFEIALRDARPLAQAAHFVGLAQLNAPFKGGTMVPTIDLINSPLFTDASGDLVLGGHWPLFGLTGLHLYFQFWVHDPVGIKGWSAS